MGAESPHPLAVVPDDEPHPLVVVAEDDTDARELLARALSRRGFLVEAVGDGEALLQRVGRGPRPALVVTDLDMPKLTGLDALPKLVELGLPVVVVSALNPRLSFEAVRQRGAVAVLAKPIRSRVLIDVIERVLRLVPAS